MKLNLNLYQLSRIGIALSCLAACYSMAADAPSVDPDYTLYTKPQQLAVLPDGRKIHLFCAGEGSPTVIFTTGLGDWSLVWNKVQGPIALKTRTCAWDRAGFGFSDPSPWPQDIKHTTDDLESALKAARIDGPYVMVGHSLGGYESLRFADRHADQVVGMVLVDPSIPNQAQRMKAVAPKLSIALKKLFAQDASQSKTCATKIKNGSLTLTSADPDECFSYDPEYPTNLKNSMRALDSKPARWVTKASLLAQFDTSSTEVINKSRNFGSMPLRILTAADPQEMPPTIGSAAIAQYPTFFAEFLHGHDALAALSTNGTNTVVQGPSHYIHLIKPDIVISTISQMVDEIQLKTKLAAKQN